MFLEGGINGLVVFFKIAKEPEKYLLRSEL